MIGKLDESVPEFFTELYRTLENLIADEKQKEPSSASEKSPVKSALKNVDLGKSMANLVHHFNQFQDFFVSKIKSLTFSVVQLYGRASCSSKS